MSPFQTPIGIIFSQDEQFYSVKNPKRNFANKTMFIYLQFHTLASKN